MESEIMSADWDQQYKDGHGRYWPAEELVRFLGRRYGHVIDQSGAGFTAVEIGCGVGGNIRALAEWGFFTHGLELSSEAIRLGKAYAKRCGFEAHVKYTQYKAPAPIKLPAKSAHVVIDVQTIQHLDVKSHEVMYREVRRILSDHGRFFSVHWVGGAVAGRIFPQHKELHQWDNILDIFEFVRKAGFNIPYKEVVSKTYDSNVGCWVVMEAAKI
jgi:SAM-dependent methyltransferase